MDIQIQVRGRRGQGTTTVAAFIARTLQALGMQVTYRVQEITKHGTHWQDRPLPNDVAFGPVFTGPREIVVVDCPAEEDC